MTPAQILALIRDVAIVGALGFLLWKVYDAGEQAVTVKDLQAVQTQLEMNLKIQAQWAQDARNAEVQRTQDMAQVSADIRAQHAPIVVRIPPSGGPVSCLATAPSAQPAAAGNSNPGAGSDTDVRPAINAYELRWSGFVEDCRAALASWPR